MYQKLKKNFQLKMENLHEQDCQHLLMWIMGTYLMLNSWKKNTSESELAIQHLNEIKKRYKNQIISVIYN